MYDYFIGGKNHFAADRETALKVLRHSPSIRVAARENRAFLGRAVRYLAAEAGIRQFLDIGTGLPTTNNVHEVAQESAPSARVVYVDNDPLVLAHARALLTSSPEGRTAYIHADLRDPEAILSSPVVREVLDFSQPVALILVAILHFVPDEFGPAKILATLTAALPPGSYVAASHLVTDHVPDSGTAGQATMLEAGIPMQRRESREFAALAFSGLELVPPGVVLVSEWRPEADGPRPTPAEVGCYGGVARKPLCLRSAPRMNLKRIFPYCRDRSPRRLSPDIDHGVSGGRRCGVAGSADSTAFAAVEGTRSEIDTSKPHPARMYDYYIGGKNHFAADRAVADKALAAWPAGRIGLRENRKFLGRVVKYLAAEAGIRQFLDIGSGLPSANNVHEVAQRIAPSSRVAYIDNDPMVLTHAQALLTSSPEGRTAYLQADLRSPERLVSCPLLREVLDFSQPIALMLIAVLHFLRDEDKPDEVIGTLLDALPPGSYLAASHMTIEHDPVAVGGGQQAYLDAGLTMNARDSDQFARMVFSGLEMVPPGVVLVSEWRPDSRAPRPTPAEVSCYGGVARKP